MAHNINYNEQTGKHAFFSVKEKPWHGLGQVVEDYKTSSEVCEIAQINWPVIRKPLQTSDGILVPNKFANVRGDNNAPLGVVGKDYQIVQNSEAFEFFDSLVGGDDGILYETAGALGAGEKIFITAKLPNYLKVKGERIDQYLFLVNTHDGSGSIYAAFTPIRIVCNNTLNAAMNRNKNRIKLRHTKNVKERLRMAKDLLGVVDTMADELSEAFNSMKQTKVKPTVERELIVRALDTQNLYDQLDGSPLHVLFSDKFVEKVDLIQHYAQTHPTQKGIAGTLFGTYNAVTGYFQNVAEYKKDEKGEKRLTSIIEGKAYTTQQKMFDLCLSQMN